jgi:hypothetical protein
MELSRPLIAGFARPTYSRERCKTQQREGTTATYGPLSRGNFISRKGRAEFADVPVFRKKLIEQLQIETS